MTPSPYLVRLFKYIDYLWIRNRTAQPVGQRGAAVVGRFKGWSMAKRKEEKTNVMRVLEQKNIPYTAHAYEHEEGVAVDGVTVARSLGQDPECVFKTLVARGASKAVYVFVIPVAENLDLKKAAKAVGEKSVEMVHVKEINALTGYVRGGCSPVGMKKAYPTVFHETAEIIDTIMVSAGKIGCQVELAPEDLIKLVGAVTADLSV